MRNKFILFLILCVQLSLWGRENYEYRYWFDDSEGIQKTGEITGGNLKFDVDLNSLASGLHYFHIQVKDVEDIWSVPITRLFVKLPQIEGTTDLYCISVIDGELYKVERVPSADKTFNWNFDVSQLTQGVHSIQLQVATHDGVVSNVSNYFFIRSILAEELNSMKLVYNVDGNLFETVAGNAVDGLYHFDLDVSSLEDGLHRITYQLASTTGTSTKFNTQFFVKTPLGGAGIMRYDYWLNDDRAKAVVIEIIAVR